MIATALVPLILGCNGNPYGDDGDLSLADDLGEWASADLTCEKNKDCFTGEVCNEGTCQIDRCNAEQITEDARPPMGNGLSFLQENEIAVADRTLYKGGYYVDAYQPIRGNSYDWSVESGGAGMVDIAGGDFDDSDSGTYAVITEGSRNVSVPGTNISIGTGFTPIALDAGDVDGDGFDEVIAIAEVDQIAVCHIDDRRCDGWGFSDGTRLVDVAVADVDGDSFEEPIILLDIGGERYLYAFHPNAEETGEELDYWSHVGSDELHRITAGDLDGDWIAEVIALKEEWWCYGFLRRPALRVRRAARRQLQPAVLGGHRGADRGARHRRGRHRQRRDRRDRRGDRGGARHHADRAHRSLGAGV